MHRKVKLETNGTSISLILIKLPVSEAACDVRPMWKELLPAEPIKASHPRCALLQEAQRIETPYILYILDCVHRLCSKHPLLRVLAQPT